MLLTLRNQTRNVTAHKYPKENEDLLQLKENLKAIKRD